MKLKFKMGRHSSIIFFNVFYLILKVLESQKSTYTLPIFYKFLCYIVIYRFENETYVPGAHEWCEASPTRVGGPPGDAVDYCAHMGLALVVDGLFCYHMHTRVFSRKYFGYARGTR